jgi:hypothetical protein
MKNKEEMQVKTGEIIFMMQSLANNKNTVVEHFRQLEQSLTFEFQQVM